MDTNIWGKLGRQVKQYTIYWFFQIFLPIIAITDFFLSHLIPEEYKLITMILALLFPLIVIFPINLTTILYEENRKMKVIARIYKSVYLYLKNIEYMRDEHHRVNEIKITFKIQGSDVWAESRIKGFNNHPESKDSNEMKLFASGDAPSESFELEVHDNIRDIDITQVPEIIEENIILYKIKYPPLKVGEPFDFTILRYWPGCIVKREEYIFVTFKHLLRGMGAFYGEIIFDREPTTYYATTLSNSGEVEKINVAFQYSQIDKKLSWKIDNPTGIYIINFILPKSRSTKKLRNH